MTCIGCERARGMLDGYVDEELSVSEQVIVEAHLRSCTTCAARVADLRLIASSLRQGAPARPTADDECALAGVQAGALIRLRTERDQAMRVRLREAFTDMRLLWPALGAVCAVVVGLAFALGLAHRAESLAARLQAAAQGSVQVVPVRPFPFDAAMVVPQLIDEDAVAFADQPDEEVVFAFAGVVSRSGWISNYEVLGPGKESQTGRRGGRRTAASADAVHDMVSRLRFAPAVAFDGAGVDIELVMLVTKMTVTHTPPPEGPAAPAPPAPMVDAADAAEAPAGESEIIDEAGCPCPDEATPDAGTLETGLPAISRGAPTV